MLASTTSSFGQASAAIPYEHDVSLEWRCNLSFRLIRAKDQQNRFEYLLSMKDRLSRPRVKYQVHFLVYLLFLYLLSYLVLMVKTSLLEINEEIQSLVADQTCSEQTLLCASEKYSQGSWSILQSIINIWIFMFALEEFRQVSQNNDKSHVSVNTFCLEDETIQKRRQYSPARAEAVLERCVESIGRSLCDYVCHIR